MAERKGKETGSSIIKREALRILEENKGKEVYLKDIRNYIRSITGEEFSAGMYSGAMRDLTRQNNSKIVNVRRGVYTYVDNAKKARINKVLDDCIKDLEEIGYINILEADREDMKYIEEIPRIIQRVRSCKIT